MNYTNELGKIVNINKNSFTSKGQAAIHKVKGENKVAKLYHSLNNNKSILLNDKLLYMIKNPPFNNSTSVQIRTSIVWPLEVLYKNNNFVGFTMPFMENYETLSELTILNKIDVTKKVLNKFTKKNNNNFLYQRLSICYNLASVLETIHSFNKYVIVDLKPSNILIDINGNIALIDIDSIQVKDNKSLYCADAHTDDYAPPEYHNKLVNYKTKYVESSWDYFVFALIAYKILFQIPAFMGTIKGQTEIIEHVKKQYFPNGQYRYRFEKIPPPHNDFNLLSKELKKAFIITFEGKISERLSFTIWKKYFQNELKLLAVNKQQYNTNTKTYNHKSQAIYNKFSTNNSSMRLNNITISVIINLLLHFLKIIKNKIINDIIYNQKYNNKVFKIGLAIILLLLIVMYSWNNKDEKIIYQQKKPIKKNEIKRSGKNDIYEKDIIPGSI